MPERLMEGGDEDGREGGVFGKLRLGDILEFLLQKLAPYKHTTNQTLY